MYTRTATLHVHNLVCIQQFCVRCENQSDANEDYVQCGGYTNSSPQSKKALMWLAYREQIDGRTIQHGRNGRECRLSELPHLKVDGYCAETRTVYELSGCYWHGCPHCQPLRDVSTIAEGTLA
ncbi:hypothetical protein Cfor_10581 [Coptotermes formosanus]|uniref:Uncharacterized protein n=1 Tax=Coptotermes formosanus TaxID=36987 RepID=A0A6L2Q4Z7_COPFO|nr:hypothetical protein Cfor_10581 [Coptotermes formosanus]